MHKRGLAPTSAAVYAGRAMFNFLKNLTAIPKQTPSSAIWKLFNTHCGKSVREMGFVGSAPYFRRMIEDGYVHVINLQAHSKWGGRCAVNLAVHHPVLDKCGHPTIDPKKRKIEECEFTTRLTTSQKENDHWWKFSEKEAKNIQMVREIVSVLVTRGDGVEEAPGAVRSRRRGSAVVVDPRGVRTGVARDRHLQRPPGRHAAPSAKEEVAATTSPRLRPCAAAGRQCWRR